MITEALAKLDPAEDKHWNQDGLPSLKALVEITGTKSITRKQVTEAAPHFTRENPTLELPEATKPSDDVQVAPPENTEEPAAVDPLVALEQAVEDARSAVATHQYTVDQVAKAHQTLKDRLYNATVELEKARPKRTTQDDISDYLAASHRARVERHMGSVNARLALGMDFPRSPKDLALMSRKRQKPQHSA